MEPDSTGQPVAEATAAPVSSQPAAAEVVAAPSSPPADDSRADFAEAFRAHAADNPAPAEDEPVGDAAPKADAPKPEPTAEPAPVKADEPPASSAAPQKTPDEIIAEYEAKKAAKAQQDEAAATRSKAAQEAHERIFGKPGEMAELLAKLADSRKIGTDVVFTATDEDRLVELTENARTYAPMRSQARADAEAEIEAARTEGGQALLNVWNQQFDAMEALTLPGFDGKHVRSTIDNLPGIVTAAHTAGAASRQAEIDTLKGEKEHLSAQLLEARGDVFRSQPPVELAGGVGAGGRGKPVLPSDASPRDEFRYAFSTAANGQNGRR